MKTTLKILVILTFLFTSSSVFAGKFVLTHMLGKKLPTPAYFYVGEQKVWLLDFRNGDKIYYTPISFNKSNLMCGIKAKDNNGDYCEICITKKDSKVIVDITYSIGTITYTGYYVE